MDVTERAVIESRAGRLDLANKREPIIRRPRMAIYVIVALRIESNGAGGIGAANNPVRTSGGGNPGYALLGAVILRVF